MSAKQAADLNSSYGVAAVVAAVPIQESLLALPAQEPRLSTREMVIIARETAMVVMLQIAFRAALLLRRWNY